MSIVTDLDVLRQVSKETSWNEVCELNLIEELKTANRNAWTKGYGLASIQIGIPLRFAWFILDNKEYTLINPSIELKMGRYLENEEGCLSIPNTWLKTERYYEIEYIDDDKKKKAKGTKARIIQHEIDHMDGILITDRLKENL